jgi:hypothetical protein
MFYGYESSLIFLAHPRRLRRLARYICWCKVGVAHFAPTYITGLSRFSGEQGLRGNASPAPEKSGMTHIWLENPAVNMRWEVCASNAG